MRPESWFDSIFSNRSKIRVLRTLAQDPGRLWTEREVSARLGVSPTSVNHAVKSLRDEGILEFHRVGRSHAIRLRPDLRVVDRIKAMFGEEKQVWLEIEEVIGQMVPAGTACYVFGSTARGQATPASDVDLLVVAATRDDAEQVAATIREAVGRVFPLDLAIISLGVTEARLRRKTPWFQNAVREGRSLATTKLEAIL